MTTLVKPGDDIAWIGEIKREGVTDFTGYTLTAEIRLKDPTTGAPGELQGTATIAWTNAALGLFTFNVARAVTAAWESNACLLLDIRIAAPGGTWLRTETIEFGTAQGVTA